jgi:hypothetical protein
MSPTIGRIVVYRSSTGRYSVPAIITATTETLYQPGVDGGHVPPLTGRDHVHLTVFTPGTPGERLPDTDPSIRTLNAGGTYQEWDIPFDVLGGDPRQGIEGQPQQPGTWAWPQRTGS